MYGEMTARRTDGRTDGRTDIAAGVNLTVSWRRTVDRCREKTGHPLLHTVSVGVTGSAP